MCLRRRVENLWRKAAGDGVSEAKSGKGETADIVARMEGRIAAAAKGGGTE